MRRPLCFPASIRRLRTIGYVLAIVPVGSTPVLGIGAGPHTTGQVLVFHDMMGITQQFTPRFLRRYLNLSEEIVGAIEHYISDVKENTFPNESEQY